MYYCVCRGWANGRRKPCLFWYADVLHDVRTLQLGWPVRAAREPVKSPSNLPAMSYWRYRRFLR